MNKGNLNKLVTNYPVPLTNEEVENLSLTLSAVRTAGGDEGKIYQGEGFVSVNNTNNIISLTTEANEKLNQPIPTKVSDLTDSASYQTMAGMNEYLTTGDAQSTYLTKISASENLAPLSVTGDVDTLKSSSGNWEASYNVLTAYSAAGKWLTEHQSLTNYYTKDETSGKTEITNALNTKVDKPTSLQTGKLVYDGDNNEWVTLPAGTTTIVQGQGSVTANYDSSNSTYIVSLLASAENALLDVDKKITIPTYSNLEDSYKVWYTYSSGWKDLSEALNDENAITYNAFTDPNYPLMVPENGISGSYDSTEFGYHFGLTQTVYNAVTSVSSKLDTTAAAQTYLTTATYSVDSATFLTKSSADNDYAPKSITATVNTLTVASAGWNDKVDKPTSLNDKYLVLRTDSNGNVSGWCDFQDQSYSKSEANGTFVATANIDSTTLSGDGKSVSTKLGVKTDVIATKDYVNSSFLPLSGGTVSNKLTVNGSDFYALDVLRNGQTSTGTIGINGVGGMSFKIVDSNSITQLNISPNATMDKRFSIGDAPHQPAAYFIPAVTATTTAGLTNDGILHIILES